MRRSLVLLSVCLLLSAGLCWGHTIYVKPDGTGNAPTIGAAMDSAAGGDTLLLASGTFVGEGNHGLIIPDKNLTIISETGDPSDCVIDCEGDFGFVLEDCWVVAKGLTITNAVGSAVILNQFCSVNLRVQSCIFSNSVGIDGPAGGGAICCFASSEAEVRIVGCSFLSNYGDRGGAIFMEGGAYFYADIYGCTFCGNTALSGGAICCFTPEANVYIRNSVFCHNSADGQGGAVDLLDSSTEIYGCTFTANSAPLSSAVSAGNGQSLAKCILAYGTAGPALYAEDPCCVPWLSCTDIYGNEGGDWVGLIADQLGQNGNFSACPSFCNYEIEPNDLHLCSASPCLPGNHPDGVICGLIGALGQGCGCGPSGIEPTTWGAIKAMHK